MVCRPVTSSAGPAAPVFARRVWTNSRRFRLSQYDADRQCRAREASYELCSRLFLEELDQETARRLRGLPGFGAAIPLDGALADWLDEMAAEYQRVFGMNVYPYEAVFVDRELLLNTAATDRVVELYHDAGFDASGARVGAPDHLGLELRLMRQLVAREGRARREGHHVAIYAARTLQRRCIAEHLARWAPQCCAGVAGVTREPLYALLATQTVDLVLGELEQLAALPASPTGPGAAATGQPHGVTIDHFGTDEEEFDPESPVPLRPYGGSRRGWDDEGEGPGINAVVRRLLTPAESGLFLPRAELSAMARALDLPAPVGDRFQMLRGLFTAAGQFDQVSLLLEALDARVGQARAFVADLRDRFPAWRVEAGAWTRRLDATSDQLAELRTQVAASVLADGVGSSH